MMDCDHVDLELMTQAIAIEVLQGSEMTVSGVVYKRSQGSTRAGLQFVDGLLYGFGVVDMKNQRFESLGAKAFEILVVANGGVHAPSMLTKHPGRRVANAAGAARDEHMSNFRTW